MKEKKVWCRSWLWDNKPFENRRNTNKIISDITLKLNNCKHKYCQFEFWSSTYCICQPICSSVTGNSEQLNYPCSNTSYGFAGYWLQMGFQLRARGGWNPAHTLPAKLWTQECDCICLKKEGHFSINVKASVFLRCLPWSCIFPEGVPFSVLYKYCL